jgi:hypothetical protein
VAVERARCSRALQAMSCWLVSGAHLGYSNRRQPRRSNQRGGHGQRGAEGCSVAYLDGSRDVLTEQTSWFDSNATAAQYGVAPNNTNGSSGLGGVVAPNASAAANGELYALNGQPPSSGSGEGSGPVTTPAPSGTDLPAYVSARARVIGGSRRELARMVAAIGDAKTAPDSSALAAQDVRSGRRALLSQVATWVVPSGAQTAQSLLEQALRLSVVSDSAYTAWMQHLDGGDQSAANAAYARAQTDDPRATAAKRRFLTAYNQLREQAGLSPVPKNKLF